MRRKLLQVCVFRLTEVGSRRGARLAKEAAAARLQIRTRTDHRQWMLKSKRRKKQSQALHTMQEHDELGRERMVHHSFK